MTPDDLQKAVDGWLKDKGFPLEMKVANLFSRAGFGIRQGWYFNDPEENKPMEIDVLAYQNIFSGHPLIVQFIIECKWARKPFVAFSYQNRTPTRFLPELQIANPVGKRFIKKLLAEKIYERLPIFGPNSPHGYAMTQANIGLPKGANEGGGGSNKDDAFDALIKVAKATHSMLNYYTRGAEMVTKEGDATKYSLAYLGLPLIVIDGPLFDCYLNADGDAVTTPIDQVLIDWSYPLLGNIPIMVCTFAALPKLIEQALQTCVELHVSKVNLDFV